jgi:uncharacterized protein
MNRRGITIVSASITAVVLLIAALAIFLPWLRAKQMSTAAEGSSVNPLDHSSLVQKANAGDTNAQLQLGIDYLENTNRPPDYTEAVKWLSQAAQAGNAQAEYLLGTLYQTGRGVKRDYTNAILWFEKAGAQKHREALYNLGSLYASGRGIAYNSEKAAQYYLQAAELGDPYAQFNVAQRFELGRGVATNLVEAWKWYSLAEQGGVADAAAAKRRVENGMTTPQLQESRQSVADFQKRTASKN